MDFFLGCIAYIGRVFHLYTLALTTVSSLSKLLCEIQRKHTFKIEIRKDNSH